MKHYLASSINILAVINIFTISNMADGVDETHISNVFQPFFIRWHIF